jgi:hypothetical protein
MNGRNRPQGKMVKFTPMYQSMPEIKAVDGGATLTADTTGSIALINGIVPGVGFYQRIGRAVQLKNIRINVTSTVTTTTGIDQYQRLIMVIDHQPNAAALAITDVLTSANTIAFKNLINQKRFKILMDERFRLNAAPEPDSTRIWSFDKKLKTVVQFNEGTAGTIADIVTNSVYLISIGSVVAGVTAGSQIYQSRVSYIDL